MDLGITKACALRSMTGIMCLAASLSSATSANTTALNKNTVQIIDSTEAPWPSVGQVNVAGYRRTQMCTGTLISPNVVLTAAHCLYSPVTGRAFQTEDLVFVAGVRRDLYAERHEIRCTKISESYRFSKQPSLEDVAWDVALIVLKKKSDLAPVPQIDRDTFDKLTRETPFTMAGYHRGRRFLPSADPSCKVLGGAKGGWVLGCSSRQGMSGGPVFRSNSGTLEISAILSASMSEGRSFAVPLPRWLPLLEDLSCPSDAAKPAG